MLTCTSLVLFLSLEDLPAATFTKIYSSIGQAQPTSCLLAKAYRVSRHYPADLLPGRPLTVGSTARVRRSSFPTTVAPDLIAGGINPYDLCT
ncbi:hypothetical protein GCM10020358_16760 [Amorphoplanes nipponensis]